LWAFVYAHGINGLARNGKVCDWIKDKSTVEAGLFKAEDTGRVVDANGLFGSTSGKGINEDGNKCSYKSYKKNETDDIGA
jgi:hypothetical protein